MTSRRAYPPGYAFHYLITWWRHADASSYQRSSRTQADMTPNNWSNIKAWPFDERLRSSKLRPIAHTLATPRNISLLHQIATKPGIDTRVIHDFFDDTSLWQSIAERRLVGKLPGFSIEGSTQSNDCSFSGLNSVIKELLAMGPSLHLVSLDSRTPFLNVLVGSTSQYMFGKPPPFEGSCHWLIQLKLGGVDLLEYGRRECELHRKGQVSWEWKGKKGGHGLYTKEALTWSMKSLRYGASPSCWQFIIEVIEEVIQPDVNKLPGAWIKDDVSESGSSATGNSGENKSDDKDLDKNDLKEDDIAEVLYEEVNMEGESPNHDNLETEYEEDVEMVSDYTKQGCLRNRFLVRFTSMASRSRVDFPRF